MMGIWVALEAMHWFAPAAFRLFDMIGEKAVQFVHHLAFQMQPLPEGFGRMMRMVLLYLDVHPQHRQKTHLFPAQRSNQAGVCGG
jgi:hypothetical protein